tara:strand:+ start:2062 stop:9342 length:7281 start_codon:yes stop_codon:yes gene_type:complete
MKKRYELNGKKYNVNIDSEKGKAWLAKNTEAILIGTIVPKKEQSSATGATQEQKTSAPEAEANQPQNNTELTSEDGSSELQENSTKKSFFEDNWFARNIKIGLDQASDTGEASDVILGSFTGDLDLDTVSNWVEANKEKAKNYKESERMKEFMDKYNSEGRTWTSFFRNINPLTGGDPVLMAELLLQSYATMAGTAADSPEAIAAAATAGGTAAAASSYLGYGALAFGAAGAMGGLATSMEASLTLGELVREELENQNKEFTDENVLALMQSDKGKSIRNKAVGRGVAIGSVEALTGSLAGKATGAVLKKGAKVASKSATAGRAIKASSVGAGVGVEAIGGGLGEVAGRTVADQELDPAEIGFEAVTGTATAPLNIGLALKNYKAPVYKLNKEIVSYDKIKDFVETASEEEVAKANIVIENDLSGLDATIYNKQNKYYIKTTIDPRVSDENDIESLVDLEIQLQKINKETQSGKNRAKDIRDEIKSITDKYKDVDVTSEQVVEKAKTKARVEEAEAEKVFQKNMEFAKKHSQMYGLEIDDTMTNEDIISKYGDQAKGAAGLVVDNKIIINKEVAKSSVNGDNVANHELLHGILKSSKANITQDLVNDFMSKLSQSDQDVINKRLQDNYDTDYIKNNLDEYFTAASDAIANGDIKFNDGIFSSIKDTIRRIFQDLGVGITVDFETGQGVYNFLKDYNRSIHKGTLSKGITKATKGEAVFDEVKASRDAKAPIDQLGKVDSDGNDMTEAGMGNFLYQAEADQIISKIKEEGYLDNLIASKYKVRPVPDKFVADVLAELTPHIKRFNPEVNDSLFGWIQGQLANKAGNVYNEIYKDKGPAKTVDVDATTTEGAPVVQLEADIDIEMERIDEMGLNDEQVQERSKFRQKLKLNDTMVDKVINAVKKVFGTKLPNINTKQFKQALTKAFKTDLKKSMQDLMGKGKAYDTFLKKFMPVIHKFLPVEVLVQMERNVKPELRIFTSSRRITKPTEVDKLISQGRLPKDTNRDSGPLLNTKLPYPGTEKILAFYRGENMQEVLGYKVGASTLGTRKDVLAERTITEVSFDAVSTVIQDEAVASKIEDLNIAGIDKVENDLAVIAKQIDRDPTIKFSMSGAKKPSGYTSDALIEHSNTLLDDIKNHGYESVIDENGKLVDGYEDLKIPQFTVNAVANWYATGNADDGVSVGYKAVIKGFKKLFPKTSETIDAYLAAGNLRYAKDHLNQLSKDAGIIANVLGENVMNAIGWEILGYKNRIMDPAKTKKDGSKGEFYDRLESSKKDVKGRESKLPKGLNPNDVNIMNIGAPGSLFKDIMKILKKDISKQEKLDLLAKLQPRIDAANKANILMAKHVAKTIVTLAREGKISPVSALHILQSQTSIVNGFRGLSRLDLIDVRDGSQAVNENHPSYKSAVKYYKKKGLSEANAKIEALKKLGFKGEHLGPNSNTMAAIAKLIFDNTDIDKALNKAFRGHSQLLTSKYITDIIDDKGGRTNDTDFNRVKFLNKADIDNIVSAGNKSYMEVLADHEVNVLIEDLFVDKSKAIELQSLESEPVSVKYSKSKGMSTFDFDETLIIGGKNFVVATKDGKTVRISSEQWPIKGPALAAQGYKFDFSDFANVRGGKEGPLLQKMKNQVKKYGSKNVFVLTARQQDAAGPIHEWLKTQGINIPLENITGLGKSEGSAKGEWMLQKFTEGYNDMYFVDDAMSNVKAVRQVLEQLDIKSKVVQAKVKFSKSASKDFNDMLERSKGVEASLEFSDIDAKLRGAKRDRFKIRFFVPPSAEDLKGLVYAFLGKGEQGNKDLAWFKDNLFTPFAKGIRELNSLRQKMSEEYTALKKQFPNVIKSLNDKVANTEFTVDNAIRVYLWNMAGFDVPGLSDAQKKLLIDHVAKNAELVVFADVLSNITRTEEGYVKPADHWIAQNIGSDLHTVAETINRKKFLAEWQENVDLIFSKENLNKIEAIYGSNFREALEDMLYRMKTGSNRPSGRTSVENKFLNWVNGAVSAVMFFNMRSAGLQGLSMVNFLNFEDNNIFKAAKAFANQKQFWADFIYLFNSDMLKQRRAGLKIDVSASELTDAFAQGKNKTEAVIKYMLEKGFIPTKMMDSFAIAMGGSTFYRNRVEKLIKQGMSKSEAESQAFLDFQEIAEETQQSSRPDLISMQQASSLGRLILAWANTPMQYTRLTKKALSDIVNGRGDLKANVSRIVYYGAVQNIIFGTLQTGLAFLMFGDDEEDKNRDKKEQRVLNGMLDTLLRGVGVYGALVSAAKNTLIAAHEELGKKYGQKDYSKIMQQLINLSPPIGSKVRKIIGAIKSYDFNKDIMDQMDHGINNPAWNVFTGVVEGVTNAPLDRIRAKLVNVREAFVGDHEMWQRIALVMGWNKWDLNVEDAQIQEARDKVKQKRKEKKVEKKYRCRANKKSGGRCKNRTDNKNKKCYAHQ